MPDPADKKIVLLTDRQVADWPVQSLADHLKELPAPIQVVRIEPDDAVGANRYGITIESITRRGLYLVSADRTDESLEQGLASRLWTLPLAVNGPAEESQLLSAEEVRRRATRWPRSSAWPNCWTAASRSTRPRWPTA